MDANGFMMASQINEKSAISPILLIVEILHQLIGSLSHYLQAFIDPRWLGLGISSMKSILMFNSVHGLDFPDVPGGFWSWGWEPHFYAT